MYQTTRSALHRSILTADVNAALDNRVLDSNLLYRTKTMLLSQGLSNADKGTGIFNDKYLRCGSVIDVNASLVYRVIHQLQTNSVAQYEYIIPISDLSLDALVCIDLQKFDVNAIISTTVMKFSTREVPCIKMIVNKKEDISDQQYAMQIIHLCGRCGALASRDTLLWILSSFSHIDNKNSSNASEVAISKKNVEEMLCAINTVLTTKPVNQKNSIEENAVIEFYQLFKAKLINGIQQSLNSRDLPLLDVEENLLCSALNRFLLKMQTVTTEHIDYLECLVLLELAFDEIINILHIVQPYNKESIAEAINAYICHNFDLEEHKKPVHTMLGSSCMQVLNNNLLSAVKYFFDASSNKPVNVYIGKEVYHEVFDVFGVKPGSEVDENICFENMTLRTVSNDSMQLSQIMIIAFHANVHVSHAGFYYIDILSRIQLQLDLRKELKSPTQLMVIIDITLTDLRDVKISTLLSALDPHIEDGRLAIIFTYSLNKFFQVGLDRTPAGISAAFFSRKSFNDFKPSSELIGFEEFDATPQIITHILKHGSSCQIWYYNHVHDLSRYIHDKVIDRELFEKENPIYFASPYADGAHKAPWNFMQLCFDNVDIFDKFSPKLEEHMQSIAMNYRGGFAYNQSTYALFGFAKPPFIRISIGPDATEKQFSSLSNFLLVLNQEIKQARRSRRYSYQ